MGALVRVNGGIEKGQWGHWSGSMGGIEKGQWRRWSGSMEALVRVNGFIGRWSGSMGVLNNGGSMGVLKKINGGGIGRGQWGY